MLLFFCAFNFLCLTRVLPYRIKVFERVSVMIMLQAGIKKKAFDMFRRNGSNYEVKESLNLTATELKYLRREYQKPKLKK